MLSAMFVYGGIDAVRNPEPKVKAAESVALPIAQRVPILPQDPQKLVQINGAVQVAAGSLLAIGKFRRLAALALIGSVIPTTYAGHRFWEYEDETARAQQRIHFLKNLGLLGGLILAAVDTEGQPSLGRRARRNARQAGYHAGYQAGKMTELGRDIGALTAAHAVEQLGHVAEQVTTGRRHAQATVTAKSGKAAAKTRASADKAAKAAAKTRASADKAAAKAGAKAAAKTRASADKAAAKTQAKADKAAAKANKAAARARAELDKAAAKANKAAAKAAAEARKSSRKAARQARAQAKELAKQARARSAPAVAAVSAGTQRAGEALSTGSQRAGEALSTGSQRAGEALSTGSQRAGEALSSGAGWAGGRAHRLRRAAGERLSA